MTNKKNQQKRKVSFSDKPQIKYLYNTSPDQQKAYAADTCDESMELTLDFARIMDTYNKDNNDKNINQDKNSNKTNKDDIDASVIPKERENKCKESADDKVEVLEDCKKENSEIGGTIIDSGLKYANTRDTLIGAEMSIYKDNKKNDNINYDNINLEEKVKNEKELETCNYEMNKNHIKSSKKTSQNNEKIKTDIEKCQFNDIKTDNIKQMELEDNKTNEPRLISYKENKKQLSVNFIKQPSNPNQKYSNYVIESPIKTNAYQINNKLEINHDNALNKENSYFNNSKRSKLLDEEIVISTNSNVVKDQITTGKESKKNFTEETYFNNAINQNTNTNEIQSIYDINTNKRTSNSNFMPQNENSTANNFFYNHADFDAIELEEELFGAKNNDFNSKVTNFDLNIRADTKNRENGSNFNDKNKNIEINEFKKECFNEKNKELQFIDSIFQTLNKDTQKEIPTIAYVMNNGHDLENEITNKKITIKDKYADNSSSKDYTSMTASLNSTEDDFITTKDIRKLMPTNTINNLSLTDLLEQRKIRFLDKTLVSNTKRKTLSCNVKNEPDPKNILFYKYYLSEYVNFYNEFASEIELDMEARQNNIDSYDTMVKQITSSYNNEKGSFKDQFVNKKDNISTRLTNTDENKFISNSTNENENLDCIYKNGEGHENLASHYKIQNNMVHGPTYQGCQDFINKNITILDKFNNYDSILDIIDNKSTFSRIKEESRNYAKNEWYKIRLEKEV